VEIEHLKTKIKQVREDSKKRNFPQTFDLVINLKNLDLKKPESKVDVGVLLDCKVKPKKYKIMAVIDHSITGAEQVFDKVIYSDELLALKGNMKNIRELSHTYDKFVVQANLMPQFAQILGRFLGPMSKMPSPKLGMIITSKTPLKELEEKIQKTAHLQTRKNLVLQVSVGAETESDSVIAKNIAHIYDVLIHNLSGHENNLKNMNLKLTMGKLVEL